VEGDVVGGGMEKLGVVSEETKTVVAPLAEQSPDRAGRMIVIEMLRLRVATDGTAVLLRYP